MLGWSSVETGVGTGLCLQDVEILIVKSVQTALPGTAFSSAMQSLVGLPHVCFPFCFCKYLLQCLPIVPITALNTAVKQLDSSHLFPST